MSMTTNDEQLLKLYAPFNQVYERSGPGGRRLSYITARMAMNRLTEVLGPGGWWDRYEIAGDRVVCHLSIRVGSETITRCDTGEAGQGDDLDGDKSIFSDAFKRAAVKFGIGLYLYQDGVPAQAMPFFENGHRDLALPKRTHFSNGEGTSTQQGQQLRQAEWAPDYRCPRTGNALYAWMKDREREFHVEVLNAVNSDPQIKDIFPRRMTDWSPEQVQIGYNKMVAIWSSHGKWPGAAPAAEKFSAEQPVTQTGLETLPAPTDEILKLRKDLRQMVITLIAKETGADPESIKAPQFLRRLNELGEPKQIHIENWAIYRHRENLIELCTEAFDALKELNQGADSEVTDDIPF